MLNFSSPKDAMDHGFALITEERKANGLFLKGDLTFNTTIANMNHYKSGIALSHDKMVRATAEEIKIMHTKCMGPDDMIANLSGGNQQKVIFGITNRIGVMSNGRLAGIVNTKETNQEELLRLSAKYL